MDDETFVFGSFRLIPTQRVLLDDGKPLRLGSRALDILVTLVESAGETIPKEKLIARAWPDTVVDEGALRVHVAALRKALGDGRAGNRYIANVPGRGYRFVAPVARMPRQPAIAPTNGMAVRGNLPAPLTRIVGRDDIIAALAAQLAQRRLLTLVGPGGIGKTTVAVAVAESVSASYDDGVWFVGLASLPDPDLVTSALGTALGISLPGANTISGLVGWLRDKRALIVLDSCEHVIGAVAAIAEAILKAAARVSILATSREPLRAEGEWLHRLASLALPPASVDLSPAEALRYPAVELFDDRATAVVDGFTLAEGDVPAVLEICRKLDGVPLAIELAAARVDVFGIKGLAARLDDRFTVLTSGRRTALPHHQTLRAAMDWSYELLPEIEQIILRRVAVFQGDFTIDAAAAVATDDRINTADVFEAIANLATKSLISTDISSDATYHRLLDTTRAYALEKLGDSGELEAIARHHAEYCRDLFERAETEWETRPAAEWLGDYGRQIDNLRAALDWAFSPSGDASIGVALTPAAAPLWMHLSLLEECRGRVEQALAALGLAASRDSRREMKLHAALAASLIYTRGAAAPEIGAVWTRTLEIAESLDDAEYQLRALWGLWSFHISVGDYPGADTLARRFHEIATRSNHPGDLLIAERMIGGALHFLGNQAAARRHIESMLSQYNESIHRPHIVRFQYDQRLAARVTLARILWAQGFPEQAMHAAADALDEAQASQHTISLCFALNEAAIPVALFVGDWVAAERYIETLVRQSAEHALIVLHARALGAEGVLASKQGDPAKGVQFIRDALRELDKSGYHAYPLLLGSLAEALGAVGEIKEGLASIEAALSRCERNGERWYIADLLRIKGELILRSNDPQAFLKAETEFSLSLQWARQQGALSWELRTASSLAGLWRDEHRVTEARALLGSVYGRFTEGFATADLQEARRLLDQLA
jgi:predicted ATPase/DNA-binding winged helix-turn-helix (wHTH) protein